MADLIKPSQNQVEKVTKKNSPLRQLIKIFRTNTVVKHHFQSPRSDKPVGVAKAFFKSGYNFQSSVIPGYSQYDRFARYSDYAEMESYPILSKALDIIADEITQKDEDGRIIKVTSDNKDIQKILTELFEDVLHLNGKDIYKLVRQLCKYGDVMYLIDATEEHGVINLINMPANEVEREEGFDEHEPSAVRFRWNTRGNVEIPNAYVAHFRLDGNDAFKPYGQSFLESARRPWRQLVLLEDAMMVYRITRAPERRVYYLDVMGIPPENIDEVVAKFNQTIKKEKVVNENGVIDLRYGATMSMEEDYIIAVRGQDSGTRIDTLPGGQNISDIDDIEFIKKNLFAALGIPKAFLTFDEDVGAKSLLTQEDIRFARTVARIQESLINELLKIAIIHLYLKGVRGSDLLNFEIKMTNPSTVAELQKNELWRARMELVQQAGEGVFDTTFIYKNFLHLTDETIDMIRKGQIMDKMFQSKLMQIEGGAGIQGDMGMGMGGMGMGGMGMDMGMGGMGMDMGMGGGMDMGLGGGADLGMGGGMDMGMGGAGALPMESKDPLASDKSLIINEAFPDMGGAQQGPPTKRKDLSRSGGDRDARTNDDRGTDEIPGFRDEYMDQDTTGDATDAADLRRDLYSPMGEHKSVDFSDLLKNYRNMTSQAQAGLLEELLYRNYPHMRPASRKARNCNSVNEGILSEQFGTEIGKEGIILSERIDTRHLLTENLKGQIPDSEDMIEDSLLESEKQVDQILKKIFPDEYNK